LRELALHILDIAENSISANATCIKIIIIENISEDILKIIIEDNGKGMDEVTLKRIIDPFVTSRTTRKVGLGIPFFKAAAEACEGTFDISSQPGKGTKVTAVFKHSHIDRMPLGDVVNTLMTLIIGTPDIHWFFEYQMNEQVFIFDDEPIKIVLDGLSLTEPSVMKFIRQTLINGVESVQSS
jgi:anti-sigma regulatory factor (Ser/Thr protein kinase)